MAMNIWQERVETPSALADDKKLFISYFICIYIQSYHLLHCILLHTSNTLCLYLAGIFFYGGNGYMRPDLGRRKAKTSPRNREVVFINH